MTKTKEESVGEYPLTTSKTICAWLKKSKDIEGDDITGIYLDPECLDEFGYFWNCRARRADFPRVTRKDVKPVQCRLTIEIAPPQRRRGSSDE